MCIRDRFKEESRECNGRFSAQSLASGTDPLSGWAHITAARVYRSIIAANNSTETGWVGSEPPLMDSIYLSVFDSESI